MDAGEDVAGETERFWEARYLEKDRIWSGKVNAVMAGIVGGLPAGRALDLGCGEGGDAVWLAQQGWTVTAVDVSQVALDRAEAHAAELGLAGITWERHDLAASFPAGPFDLVSAQFLQSPIEFPRVQVLRRATAALAPGGRLLSISHAAFPPWSKHAHHDVVFPTPEEELEALDLDPRGWVVERCEVVEREGTGPDGEAGTLFDAVILVRCLQ
ncbi:class I SAM-dependent methyltransferase [Aquihabitans daechungensis]|uniref:class I SAM-dependent methyltransferase n=1 Tax=Aquihabitans daechungensis TaxID=1052257 RepID=UPI003B9EDF26